MNVRRPVSLFLGSFVLGIIIAYNPAPTLFKVLVGAIAIFLYGRLIYLGKLNARVVGFIIVLFLIGFYRFKNVEDMYDRYAKRVVDLGKGNKEITGKVVSIGKSTNSNYYIIRDAVSDGRDLGMARVYFSDEIITDAKIGNAIRIYGGTSVIEEPSNEGEFNQKNYYRSSGITFIIFAKEIEVTNASYDRLRQKVYEIKLAIKSQIDKTFETRDAGLFMAMLTGDRSKIDKEQKKTYSENGIAHIIAISGLHLSILGLALFEILRRVFSVNVSAGITSIFIFLYGIFIDASAASLRAICMLYVRFMSLAFGRTYDSKNTLYIICLIILFLHPYLFFNAGFQFSYVAIFALNSEVYIKKKEKIKVPAVIILNLFLFPITIYHYFTYPLYSILLNLVVIPLMPFVLGFGLLSLAVSFVYIPFASLIAKIIHLIFLIYDKLCLLLEKLPYHILWLGRPTLYEVLYYYVAIFLIMYAISNLYVVPRVRRLLYSENEKYIAIRNRIFEYRLYNAIRLVICFVLLAMSILIIGIRNRNDLRMTFISIGQGDSIVIESNDFIMSVDGGSTSNTSNGEYILVPHMKSRAIDHIDYAFITHADSDHTNGLMYLIDSDSDIKVYNLMLPINAKTDTKFNKLKNLARANDVNITYLSEMDKLSFKNGLIDISVLSPDVASLENKKMDQNELSLTFRMDYKNHSCLFTGDIGKLTMDRMVDDSYDVDNMKAEVLKVPHHGSKNSNVKEFFEIVKPELAVVSYGKNNTYGHPHDVTMESIIDTGAYILKTGEKGQIDIYFDKDDIYYGTYNN